jgi:PadR family transcriptional regulator PadR
MVSKVRRTQTTLVVLRAFIDAPGEALSGAEIGRRTGIPSGSRYPLLDRLEKAGWLEGWWEDIDPHKAARPRARLYSLTRLGRQEACRVLNICDADAY